MDLFEIKLRLEYQEVIMWEVNRLFWMFSSLEYYIRVSLILPEVTSWSSSRKSFNYLVILETCNIHNRVQPCEVSNSRRAEGDGGVPYETDGDARRLP